jgi:superfamily I DNA/RNA helicase
LAGYEKTEIRALINFLIDEGYLVHTKTKGFFQVIMLTEQGSKLLANPIDLNIKKNPQPKQLNYELDYTITEQEKVVFNELQGLLKRFNELQKKTIISHRNHILCIAGPGSGKTTVLTERTRFLINYQSINPKDILVITFTRKAREELEQRLNIRTINIHTFNSFAERELRMLSDQVYGRQIKVISNKERYEILMYALKKLGYGLDKIFETYFSKAKQLSRTKEQLLFLFIYDIYNIIEIAKTQKIDLNEHKEKDQKLKLIVEIIEIITKEMQRRALRDYADQMLDYVGFIKKNPSYIPKFKHILVDEYQDVNDIQIELLRLLNPENLFAVGDPRQSIYGWRGSRIEYILEFKRFYPNAEIIPLLLNYRSKENIVKIFNEGIKSLGLPDLEAAIKSPGNAEILAFQSIDDEFSYVLSKLKENTKKTFILARTNKQIDELSLFLKGKVSFDVADDHRSSNRNILLSTVHSIKGMEAERVIIIGSNSQNFPIKTPENSVIELLKPNYNQFEEEIRLFYVALSRAKDELIITYTGKKTNFITTNMLQLFSHKLI